MGTLSTCTRIFRVLFALINAFILLIGVAVFSIGVYLQVDTGRYKFVTGNDHFGPGILIACGIFTSALSVLGIYGVCCKSKIPLVIYSIALTVIIVLQVAAGIAGLVYRDVAKDKFEDRYNDKLFDAIKEYSNDKSARKTLDYLQKEAKCCGIEDPSDWAENGLFLYNNNGNLPKSCNCDSEGGENSTSPCGILPTFTYEYEINGTNMTDEYNSDNLVWTKGCYNDTVKLIEELAVVYGGVGLTFGLFEVTVLFMAVGLVFCIYKTNKDYEVV